MLPRDATESISSIAATFTANPLIPYLGVKCLDGAGSIPLITVAPYDQIFQVCLSWQAMFSDRAPTAIILMWRIEDVLRSDLQEFLRGNPAAFERAVDKTGELRTAVASLRRSFSGTIIVSIPPFPHGPDHDIRAARTGVTAGSFHRHLVDKWISGMEGIAGVSFLDLDSIQRLVGIEHSVDARKWYLYRQPYTEEFWHEVAEDLSITLKRQRNAAKKCLVVDCDNTLWGGIVGEDGLEGIALGEDFPGSALRDFQHQLLTLRSKGVMLAICSKNNENDVWDVFDRHDGMVLKREHFVAHRINWNDKAANIVSIAKELNIGLDSLVFVETARSRSTSSAAHFRWSLVSRCPAMSRAFHRSLNSFRLFDREQISEEDRVRSEMMLQESGRKALATVLTAEEFTKALEAVGPFLRGQGGTHHPRDAAHQQDEPIQFDYAAKDGGGGIQAYATRRGQGLRVARGGSVRGLRPGRRRNIAAGRRGDRHRYLADELPGAGARCRGGGIRRHRGPRSIATSHHAARPIHCDAKELARCRPLSRSRIQAEGGWDLGVGRAG